MIKSGYTLCHEHMAIDLAGVKNDDDCRLNCYTDALDEMKSLYERGVRNIIDMSNIGMGRNIDVINLLEAETGINILCATGAYKDPFIPNSISHLSENQIADLMVSEITCGIDGKKASVIGEVGTSLNEITLNERKVLIASAIAQAKTGVPIFTHTTLGTMGIEQLELLEEWGANLKKVVISHPALKKDFNYLTKLISSGCKIAFDTIGKLKYQSDEVMADWICDLIAMGKIKNLLLSMDITRKSHLVKNGGVGYCYLFESFIPKLYSRGVTKEQITTILQDNVVDLFK